MRAFNTISWTHVRAKCWVLSVHVHGHSSLSTTFPPPRHVKCLESCRCTQPAVVDERKQLLIPTSTPARIQTTSCTMNHGRKNARGVAECGRVCPAHRGDGSEGGGRQGRAREAARRGRLDTQRLHLPSALVLMQYFLLTY